MLSVYSGQIKIKKKQDVLNKCEDCDKVLSTKQILKVSNYFFVTYLVTKTKMH